MIALAHAVVISYFFYLIAQKCCTADLYSMALALIATVLLYSLMDGRESKYLRPRYDAHNLPVDAENNR